MLVVRVRVQRVFLPIGFVLQFSYLVLQAALQLLDGLIRHWVQLFTHVFCVYFVQNLVYQSFGVLNFFEFVSSFGLALLLLPLLLAEDLFVHHLEAIIEFLDLGSVHSFSQNGLLLIPLLS